MYSVLNRSILNWSVLNWSVVTVRMYGVLNWSTQSNSEDRDLATLVHTYMFGLVLFGLWWLPG